MARVAYGNAGESERRGGGLHRGDGERRGRGVVTAGGGEDVGVMVMHRGRTAAGVEILLATSEATMALALGVPRPVT